MSIKRIVLLGVAVVLLISGAFVLGKNSGANSASGDNGEDRYPLLARRLFLDNPSDTRINFSGLRTSLNNYFAQNNIKGSAYFEYLPTGTAIRVNDGQEYTAASLMKLPVAMELYKASELGKVDLDKKIALKQEWLNDGYGTLYEKGAGYELTLRDAAKILLTESDNTALRAIIDATDNTIDIDNRALASLDVAVSQNKDQTLNIGTRSYSSFLKCLYFSCYDNKEHSQEILNYLTESKFDNRIVAGIADKSIKVAHKIGVFNTKVQSDCGIVYLEDNNYVLCAMIEGNDVNATNQRFQDISKQVYDYVKNSPSN